ncbi:ribosome silencing factor [Calothrix sp. FACHB-1219]|uniref:ribosome silencing factor n=1 Tax=unclassified Calothrix TaxID=2619626 RepID=UPI001687D2F7|nr:MULTISPECIES: ribosome silencing factor [unclassified Calothrix]MBD2205214.1 ribosome silencing factor [Calothrix sp. FACHB-168]MBD2216620.1 ribosome silencing factor [Calothrix sp. FACHB-1219]
MSEFYQGDFPIQSVSLKKSAIASPQTETDEARKLAITIAEAASDRKAGEILLLRVGDVSYLADYFVMMTGYSRVQVRAIAEAIEEQVATDLQRNPLRTAGKAEGSWVLQDYGEVIVHIMMPKEREFYNLEAFWSHAERLELPTADDGGGKPT